MKAHKINLKDYKVKRMKIEDGKQVEEDFGIREVMANVMCHPSLKHDGYRHHTISRLADRIVDCKKDFIVFDGKDFDMVKKCFTDFKGYGRNDGEMTHRIYEAEEVQMEEKKEKKK